MPGHGKRRDRDHLHADKDSTPLDDIAGPGLGT